MGRSDRLCEKHGERVGFLAGAASGDPDSQRPLGRGVRDQIRDDVLGQVLEYFRVAEEAGDVDQQILGQQIELGGILAQDFEVAAHVVRLDRSHRDAPLDPPLQGARLVEAKVVGRLGAQELDDARQRVGRLLGGRSGSGLRRAPCVAGSAPPGSWRQAARNRQRP